MTEADPGAAETEGKNLQHVQCSLDEPIAHGRTAEIYAWQEGWILKLFHEWFPSEGVQYESWIAGDVHRAGLPVPAVGEIVKVNMRRWGLPYERVDGPTMLDELRARPWTLWSSARLLAALQARMHTTSSPAKLPPLHQHLEEKIGRARGLDPGLQAAVLARLQAMPSGDRVCHGDFHPGNVILSQRGPVVIDWIDAYRGSSWADVARSSIILQGESVGARSWLQRVMVGWYHGAYLKHYLTLNPGGEAEIEAWRPIVAAGRLSEGITEIEEWLLAQVKGAAWANTGADHEGT